MGTAAPGPDPGTAKNGPDVVSAARRADLIRPARSDTTGPQSSFTASGQHGPPGGYGSWKLRTGTSGQRDLLVALDPVATQDCDHRYEAKGHDPGVKLRHLTQIRTVTPSAMISGTQQWKFSN